jgi:hypothetical protein
MFPLQLASLFLFCTFFEFFIVSFPRFFLGSVRRTTLSPSGNLRLTARHLKRPSGESSSHFLEVWSETTGKLEHVFDVGARKLHDFIYEDGQLLSFTSREG